MGPAAFLNNGYQGLSAKWQKKIKNTPLTVNEIWPIWFCGYCCHNFQNDKTGICLVWNSLLNIRSSAAEQLWGFRHVVFIYAMIDLKITVLSIHRCWSKLNSKACFTLHACLFCWSHQQVIACTLCSSLCKQNGAGLALNLNVECLKNIQWMWLNLDDYLQFGLSSTFLM